MPREPATVGFILLQPDKDEDWHEKYSGWPQKTSHFGAQPVRFTLRKLTAGWRKMHNDDLLDEVTFWLELIQQWEANNPPPAPKRMREALEQAQEKQKKADDWITSLSRWLH